MFINRPSQLILLAVMVGSLLVAGCSSIGKAETVEDARAPLAQTPANTVVEVPASPDIENTPDNPAPAPSAWGEELSKYDNQGAVEVKVTPVNLDNPGETIEFEVSLNTHSVDLSMDLADLASLETDTGLSVEASLWDAPLGGHHVGGKLSFPASVEGSALLEGAGEVRLIISGLDAPERIFTWQKQ